MFSFVVDRAETLAAALRRHAPAGTSWESVRRWVRSGKVSIAGTRQIDPACRLTAGQVIELDFAARRVKQEPSIAIVFEDSDVIVVDKPAGVSSVPYAKRERGTAMDLIRAAWRQSDRRHATSQPLLIVHRIDKETSGLLVFAKNKPAERALAAQLRAHTMDRAYLCIAQGQVKSQRIESVLLRNRGDGLRGSAKYRSQINQGKRAVTHIERLQGLKDATLCRVRLETGKTHQIRIHLAEAGHPLVGEKVYIRDHLRQGRQLLGAGRLLLHAAELGFVHPRLGQKMQFTSPLPRDFRDAQRALT